MKLVVAWIGMLAVAALVATSCSIKHASEQFECAAQADCDELGDGRVCSGGFCVVPGDGKIDAGPGKDAAVDASRPDAAVCPTQCTSCNPQTKECVIDCAMTPNGCSAQVVCPPGYACNIKCTTQNSCRNGVNCLDAKSCSIDCAGNSSCRNVACGGGPCAVKCSGQGSCRGVSCGQSCGCDVTCGDAALCENVICTSLACRVFGGGCTSMRTGCDSCP